MKLGFVTKRLPLTVIQLENAYDQDDQAQARQGPSFQYADRLDVACSGKFGSSELSKDPFLRGSQASGKLHMDKSHPQHLRQQKRLNCNIMSSNNNESAHAVSYFKLVILVATAYLGSHFISMLMFQANSEQTLKLKQKPNERNKSYDLTCMGMVVIWRTVTWSRNRWG